MLDLNFIREQPEVLRKALVNRQMESDVVDTLLALDSQRRQLLVKVLECLVISVQNTVPGGD